MQFTYPTLLKSIACVRNKHHIVAREVIFISKVSCSKRNFCNDGKELIAPVKKEVLKYLQFQINR